MRNARVFPRRRDRESSRTATNEVVQSRTVGAGTPREPERRPNRLCAGVFDAIVGADDRALYERLVDDSSQPSGFAPPLCYERRSTSLRFSIRPPTLEVSCCRTSARWSPAVRLGLA